MSKEATPVSRQIPIPSDRRRAYRLRRRHYRERYDLIGLEFVDQAPQLEQEKQKLTAQVNTLSERLLRVRADFENFRKRTARERNELVQLAHADLVAQLLPVLDNFELALSSSAAATTDASALLEGVQMIQSQLLTALGALGLEKIKAEGEIFNPHLHEAVGVVEASGAKENTVVEVLRPGYMLNVKVLRPAMVKVSRPKPARRKEK
jgi:molecular chaperone GrpE